MFCCFSAETHGDTTVEVHAPTSELPTMVPTGNCTVIVDILGRLTGPLTGKQQLIAMIIQAILSQKVTTATPLHQIISDAVDSSPGRLTARQRQQLISKIERMMSSKTRTQC